MELGNAPIGQYRSHDPPKNFLLKVKLWRVTSSSVVPAVRHQSLPLLQHEEGAEPASEAIEMADRGPTKEENRVEEVQIRWQEKLFSEREIKHYENPLNQMSALDQKYSEDISKLVAGKERKNKRVFTYVDADCHRVDAGGIFSKTSDYMTTSPDEQPTFLMEKMSQLNLMSVGRRNLPGADQHPHIVEEVPSKHVKDSHVITTPSKLMYIMADLSADDQVGTRDDEYVLCVLKIDANGQITIKPDLSKSIPYRIETFDQAKEIYEYFITDVSQQMTNAEKTQESNLLNELYDRHAEVMTSQSGLELYPQPALDELIYYIFGEIVCAKNFECDDLFVELFVDLPPNWRSLRKQTSWTTQRCSINSDDVIHFSFPFELQLVFKYPEDDSEPFVTWPTLFFEVVSWDSWQRYRKEGYGYITLPSSAGNHLVEAPTWRPCGNDTAQQMRRFFTGGAPELEDIEYVKIPPESEGNFLSKFGFKTCSSGVVTVRMHTILQHRASRTTRRGRGALKKFKATAGVLMAVDSLSSVLETFHRAKRRMLAAKSTLPVIT
ncbi:tectonic-like complex member MKS1 [Rhopilema esculentum]|uniref:tectonic-like complex member MKS1 n=1 Tax=Rhopilema esculentum TaxID=499914 RepID=UPI0031DAE49B